MTDGPGGVPADETPGGASRYVDTEGVYDFLVERLGRESEWALSPHDAGLGNETLFLVWGGRQFVLRRPPLGDAPSEAHDIRREFRLLELLDDTDLPTPRPVACCTDESVAGTAFTVQERRDGDVLRHGEPASYATGGFRDRVGTELVDTLAALHALDPGDLVADRTDVDDLSRTPADRVTTWRDRFDDYRADTDRPVPGVDEVADWLATNAPSSRARTLVHGDITLANVQFSRETPPEVVGVLDWERGGVGDPLADLGRLLAFWYDDSSEVILPNAFVPTFTARSGFPTRSTLVAAYEDATERQFEHDRFYRALAVFEMAALCEGYYLRHLRGASDRTPFAELETAVPALLDRALGIVDGDQPL